MDQAARREQARAIIKDLKTPAEAWAALEKAGLLAEERPSYRRFILRDPDLCLSCNGTGYDGMREPCYACDGIRRPEDLEAKHPWTLEDIETFAVRWEDLLNAESAARELVKRLSFDGQRERPIVWRIVGWGEKNDLPYWSWGLISELRKLVPTEVPRHNPNAKNDPFASFPGWADIAVRAWEAAAALGEAGVLPKQNQIVAKLPNPFEPARRLGALGCGAWLSDSGWVALYFIKSK